MDENENLIAKDLTDLPGIARQIYASGASQKASIMIGSFKFECETRTGTVRNVTNQEGSVTFRLGEGSMPLYAYEIRRALGMAAKLDLIDRIKSLGDPKLNAVIQKHTVDIGSISEDSVNSALARILLEVKIPVIAKFGIMKPQQTREQQIVYKALKTTGTDNISTYGDVETVWSQISNDLKTSQPTPRISNDNP